MFVISGASSTVGRSGWWEICSISSTSRIMVMHEFVFMLCGHQIWIGPDMDLSFFLSNTNLPALEASIWFGSSYHSSCEENCMMESFSCASMIHWSNSHSISKLPHAHSSLHIIVNFFPFPLPTYRTFWHGSSTWGVTRIGRQSKVTSPSKRSKSTIFMERHARCPHVKVVLALLL